MPTFPVLSFFLNHTLVSIYFGIHPVWNCKLCDEEKSSINNAAILKLWPKNVF